MSLYPHYIQKDVFPSYTVDINLWCVLTFFFVVHLFFKRKRMLFMDSFCRNMSLAFLRTTLIWGRWVMLALFDDIILLLKHLHSTSWLTSAWATEPHHYTLATYWQTYTDLLSTGNFSRGLHYFFIAVLYTFFPCPPLYFPRTSRSGCDLLDLPVFSCKTQAVRCVFLALLQSASFFLAV